MAFWGVPRGGVSSGVLEPDRGKLVRVGGMLVVRGSILGGRGAVFSSGVPELDRGKLVRVGGILGVPRGGWNKAADACEPEGAARKHRTLNKLLAKNGQTPLHNGRAWTDTSPQPGVRNSSEGLYSEA